MVRTVRFHELGGPEVLRVESLPRRAPGPREVRLSVEALGLNRAEALFRRGQYIRMPALPSRIGYDAAGVVNAVGAGVEGIRVGDRVATLPAFEMSDYGVYGEEAVVPAHAIAPWPEGLRAEEAVAVWTPWVTVWGGLVKDGELRAGDWVLLTGAASSVGLAAIQTAHAAGARVIATTRSPKKRDALRRAGAEEVIVTSAEALPARVLEVTSGHGADVAFDPVAGPAIAGVAAAMAPRGRVVIYGYMGGLDGPMPLAPMFHKRLTVRAHSIFGTTSDPAALAEAKAYVLERVRSGAFRPVIDRVYSLDDVVEAHRALEADQQIGKIVLTTQGRSDR